MEVLGEWGGHPGHRAAWGPGEWAQSSGALQEVGHCTHQAPGFQMGLGRFLFAKFVNSLGLFCDGPLQIIITKVS